MNIVEGSGLDSQEQTLQAKSILVVDDDKDILLLYRMILSTAGYSVETADTGASAIEKSKKQRFEVATFDIVLPDMQGTTLLVKITAPPNEKMRKIMITGNASLENAIQSLNLGANAYLRKPVDKETLLESVAAQLQIQDEQK